MALVGSDFYSNDSTKPPVVEYRFMYIIPAAITALTAVHLRLEGNCWKQQY